MRALYRLQTGCPSPQNGGNAGLWYDKYCDQWQLVHPENPDIPYWSLGEQKSDWIETVTGPVGVSGEIAEACRRRQLLAEQIKGQSVAFSTQWRFVTGLGRQHPVENGFAWHQTLGIPYLPGPSVKGMIRAWAEHWEVNDSDSNTTTIERMFGPKGAESAGSIIVFDALPIEPVMLETDIMTPHYAPWYADGDAPGDWHDPVPIPFLTVAKEQKFLFTVAPRRSDEQSQQDVRTAIEYLKCALEWIGAGAKTAVGYGRMTQLDDGEQSKLISACLASDMDCEWVDTQLQAISAAAHCTQAEALRGKILATRWSELSSGDEKDNALACIKARWDAEGWWEDPPGRGARRVKNIYLTGGES